MIPEVVTVEFDGDNKITLTCVLETCPKSDCKMEFTLEQWKDLAGRFKFGEFDFWENQ